MSKVEMPLLDVRDLVTHFNIGGGFLGNKRQVVHAVDGINFTIAKGEILGLVGESGCGKSTVGRTLLKLTDATSGEVYYDGVEYVGMSQTKFNPMRRNIQMIFQDPFASLNPRMTIEQIIAEPLYIHRMVTSKQEATKAVADMLGQVGLDPKLMTRNPHALSGGQRQRVGIARALIVEPDLIIVDEAVSALDVSIQAQILNLLKDLQREKQIAMLFISHDLGVVRHISDRVAIMYLGQIVEMGSKHQIFESPAHPYTQLLLNSIPKPDPRHIYKGRENIGEPGSPINPPKGCRFNPRCIYSEDKCRVDRPQRIDVGKQHHANCHFIEKIAAELSAN